MPSRFLLQVRPGNRQPRLDFTSLDDWSIFLVMTRQVPVCDQVYSLCRRMVANTDLHRQFDSWIAWLAPLIQESTKKMDNARSPLVRSQ